MPLFKGTMYLTLISLLVEDTKLMSKQILQMERKPVKNQMGRKAQTNPCQFFIYKACSFIPGTTKLNSI